MLLLTLWWYPLYSHRKSTVIGRLYCGCIVQFLCFRLVGAFLGNTKDRTLFILEDDDSVCGYCIGAFDSRVFNDQSNEWFEEVGVVHLSVNYFVFCYIFSG